SKVGEQEPHKAVAAWLEQARRKHGRPAGGRLDVRVGEPGVYFFPGRRRHTSLMGTTSTHAVNPAINPKLPYDNLADFTAVTLVATFPNVLVAHPSTASSLPELIARLKANPGKYNFGSSGAGSSTHLPGELLKLMTQTDLN